MIDQETRRKMRIIGVPEALDIMDAMAADPSYANMGFDERVRVIVDYVAQEKENASVKRLLQRAHFRIANADVSGVVYDGRPLSRDTVNGLGTCQFVESATDVIVVGYTGTGKTFLACSIGRQACKHCLSTLYVRMPDLLMSREEDLAAGIPESKVLKKYARYKVLVVDEWLMDPLNPDQMRFFLVPGGGLAWQARRGNPRRRHHGQDSPQRRDPADRRGEYEGADVAEKLGCVFS